MKRMLVGALAGLVLIGGWVERAHATAAGESSVLRRAYAKYEYRIPMRDGARLYTAVYVPADRDDPRPILLSRTPYSCDPYGADRYPEDLSAATAAMVAERYILVCQDVRGRWMSEGEFADMRPLRAVSGAAVDEATDTFDTIEWLLANLGGLNGRVGLWGNSYDGFYTAMGLLSGHPALVAALPSAPIADWYFDDMHHHGMFTLALTFPFFEWFGRPRPAPIAPQGEPEWYDYGTPDGYRFYLDLGPVANIERQILKGGVPFWTTMTRHPDYDELWQARSILPHLEGVTAAVLVVGGWFDAEDLYGTLATYAALERLNPKADVRLVMGPWRHGTWFRDDGRRLGPTDFGFDTAAVFRDRVMVPFFRNHLDGGPPPELPEASVFETGVNRWRELATWPPAAARPCVLYLAADGALAEQPPAATTAGGEAASFDAFLSDPAKPVPFTPEISTGWHPEYMVEDQRFAATRPDVLVYRSEPLTEAVTLAGPMSARLWVSTTGADADWVVKVIDEYPPRLPGYDPNSDAPDLGHTQRLVRLEGFRGRYRHSYSAPEPFVPDQAELVEIPLQAVFHTFLPGHRVMLQVQSTLFPLFDRNPQTWVDNIFDAEASDFRPQTHRVWHDPDHPSAIELTVLPGPQLP